MHPNDISGLVLFSGIGGSSLGLHLAGITDTVSVEWDAAIAAAANDNGINTVCVDVRTLDPLDFVKKNLRRRTGRYLMLQASPPCTSFSPAGKQNGKNDLPVLTSLLKMIGAYGPEQMSAPNIREHFRAVVAAECQAETSALSLEPIFWIAALMPDFISFEQVTQVQPLWDIYAEVLKDWGYSVWTGKVSAETLGVPQTRKRSYLLASLHGPVEAPAATHSRFYPRSPEKLDEGLPKWISMAEALSVRPDGRFVGTQTPRGAAVRHSRSTSAPSQTLTSSAGSFRLEEVDPGAGNLVMVSNYGTGGDPRNRGKRSFDEPCATVTSKIDRNRIEEAA